MNRLKKKSKADLTAISIMAIISTPSFIYMAKSNVQGWGYLAVFLVAGIPILSFSTAREFRFYKSLDEREQGMCLKATIFSMFVFVGFWFIFTFSALFLAGGLGAIPAGMLPLVFVGSLVVAQMSETIFLTIYFMIEGDEDTEGGGV